MIANLLSAAVLPESMTVTIQKELADRITAKPGTKDYGALSVWIQSQCRTELVRSLPPTVFWPRPKVTSAIIHVEVDARLRSQIPDLAFFHDFVRSLFFHRRKFLRSVLHSALKGRLDKSAIDELIRQTGLSAESRAEQLDVAAILSLAEAVRGSPEHRTRQISQRLRFPARRFKNRPGAAMIAGNPDAIPAKWVCMKSSSKSRGRCS